MKAVTLQSALCLDLKSFSKRGLVPRVCSHWRWSFLVTWQPVAGRLHVGGTELSVKTLALKLQFQEKNNSLPGGMKGILCVLRSRITDRLTK